MNSSTTIRFAGVLAAVASIALAGCASAAAAGPSISVQPATGLSDGQQVTVAAGGFPGGSTVSVVECFAGNTAQQQCQAVDQHGTADSSGSLSITATVHKSFDTPGGTVNCATAPGCSLAAAVDRNTFAPAVPISFG